MYVSYVLKGLEFSSREKMWRNSYAIKGEKYYVTLREGVRGNYEQLDDRGENQPDSEAVEGF